MATLRKFETIQLEGVHPRNPVTQQEIPEFLQWFIVTDDMDGQFIDPTKLSPRPDLHHGLVEPIPMALVVKVLPSEFASPFVKWTNGE